MLSLHSHQAFDLSILRLNQWELPPHKHQFFELVYIMEGNGVHTINGNEYNYQKGSLFLLTPEDNHFFKIEKETTFCIIVITKIYFSATPDGKQGINFVELFQKLEYIFFNHNNENGEPVKDREDRLWIDELMKRLIIEVEKKSAFHEVIEQSIVFLLLNQIARSIQESNKVNFSIKNPSNITYDIIAYIHQNIYDKNKLKIESLAEAFCKSKNYISQYFKDNTGETIKEYILNYKLNLVKSRLNHSDMTISEIACELGFTDESHMNKLFKEREGITAKEFKGRVI